MGHSRRSMLGIAAALAAAVAVGAPAPASAQKTLRAVMHSDLKILDPIWTTAYIVRNHGYMVYDTLFATDANGAIKPQMVDKHEVSADQLTHTFTLRDGLAWHDGQPVTAEDCVASIKRWAAKDSTGQKLMTFVDGLEVEGRQDLRHEAEVADRPRPARARQAVLQRALHDAEAGRRDRSQHADLRFHGLGSLHLQARRVEARRQDGLRQERKYKPRSEPASGLAGGKVVKVDRVEWRAISDHQQAVNALLAGEIDFIEAPPHDLLPLGSATPTSSYVDWNPLGQPVHVPAQLAAQAVRQSQGAPGADLRLQPGGLPRRRWSAIAEYYKVCKSYFPCGTPLVQREGHGRPAEIQLQEGAGAAEGSRLRRHADRADALDRPAVLTNLAPVAKSLMEKAGFKVDMQSMDWQTLVARRSKKDPPNAGGWHAFLTSWVAADITNPIFMGFMNAGCDKAMFGWPCDADMEKLRDDFARETDPAKQKAHRRGGAGARGAGGHPHPARAVVSGRADAQEPRRAWWRPPAPVFWNIAIQ